MSLKQWLYTLPLRLRSLLRRDQLEQELDEEMRYHLDRRIEGGMARGLTRPEAEQAARRAMDGLDQRKEECRDARRVNWIEDLGRDLRYALRTLRRDKGFNAVALACLALGIGANTAIFSLMNAVMLRALQVKNPERLVLLRWTSAKALPRELRFGSSGYGQTSLSPSTLAAMRERSRTLSDVIAFVPLGFNNQSVGVRAGGNTFPAGGEMVTGNYFAGLGVRAPSWAAC